MADKAGLRVQAWSNLLEHRLHWSRVNELQSVQAQLINGPRQMGALVQVLDSHTLAAERQPGRRTGTWSWSGPRRPSGEGPLEPTGRTVDARRPSLGQQCECRGHRLNDPRCRSWRRVPVKSRQASARPNRSARLIGIDHTEGGWVILSPKGTSAMDQ
jgi:hypothetical protein